MTILVKIKLVWNSEGHGHGHPYYYIIFILLAMDFLDSYEILIGWFSRNLNFEIHLNIRTISESLLHFRNKNTSKSKFQRFRLASFFIKKYRYSSRKSYKLDFFAIRPDSTLDIDPDVGTIFGMPHLYTTSWPNLEVRNKL